MSDQETAEGATETATPEEENEARVWATLTGQEGAGTSAEDSVDDSHEADADQDAEEPAQEASSDADEGGNGTDANVQRPDHDQVAEREKRYRGTISAKDRKIRELEQQIAGFRNVANEERADSDQIESLEQLREEYPDLLDPILQRIDDLRQQQDGMRQQLGAVSEYYSEKVHSAAEEQAQLLEDRMPGWETLVGDNLEEFWDWVDDQPKAIRELAEASQDVIQDADATYDMLARFKAHHYGEPAHQQAGKATSQPKRGASASRRLAGAQGVSSRGSQSATANPQPDETDEVAIWKKLTAQG